MGTLSKAMVMSSLIGRLFNIARSNVQQAFGHILEKAEDRLDDWESRVFGEETAEEEADHRRRESRGASAGFRKRPGTDAGGYPQQVVADLATFDLKPPSSLSEVRRARNREMKKFHSDRFVNDPDKFQTSKQIMQIYNAAYDRLRKYYESQSG